MQRTAYLFFKSTQFLNVHFFDKFIFILKFQLLQQFYKILVTLDPANEKGCQKPFIAWSPRYLRCTVVQGWAKIQKWLCFFAFFISYLETSCQMWLRTTFFLLIYQFNAIWQLLFAKKGLFFCSKNAHFLLKNGSSLFFSPENGFHVMRLKNWYDIVEIYSKQEIKEKILKNF